MKSDRFARRTMVCAWAVLSAAWALQADTAFAGATDDPAGSPRLGEALLRIEALRAELDQQGDRPASADAWNELAWLEYRYGRDNDAALEAAEKACSLNPSHFKAHELAGRLEYFVGHRDRVLAHWLSLLDEDRPEVELYISAAVALGVTQTQVDAAMERLGEVERSHPSAIFVTLAGRLLAEYALQQGRFEAAQRGFANAGSIDAWLIIGPFSSERDSGFGVAYGPESEIDLEAEYVGRNGPVSWRRLKALTLRRSVDLSALFYPRDQVLAYALTYVHSPVGRNATLRLGSSGATKVWLNDRLCYASDLDRSFTADQTTIPIRLEPGANKLLVKVCVETGPWTFAVRVTDLDGRPMKGLDFRREPPAGGTPDRHGAEPPEFDYALSMQDHFEQLAEQEPDNEDALYYLGLAQNANQFRTEASKTFERLAKLNGRCADHYRLLARAYLRDDKSEKALEAMKTGVSIDPGNLRLQLMLARFYNRRGLLEKERDVLKIITERHANWRELDFQWAENFRNEGWEELAFRKIKKRHEQEPTDLSAAISYAQMCAARGYTDRVSELVEQILALDITNGFAQGERLARAVLEERIDDAMAEYELRNRLEPLAFPLRLEQARLMMRNERCDEAIRQCNLALDICPDDPAIHRLLGTIHQRMGNDQTALESFQTALKCRPEDRWLRAYLEYLEPVQDPVFERYAFTADQVEELLGREVTPERYPKSDSVFVLDEMITQIHEDGSSRYRIHQIAKVLNERGREQWTRVGLPPGARRVKRAVVIQPDGTEVEAARVGGSMIDFAQVQPGSIVEFVVIGYAPANDWISRHYNEQFFFQSNDPMIVTRFILLAPENKPINAWHQGEHVAYRTERFQGHDVHIWEARDVPRIEDEPNRPPYVDLCEQVRVSTIPDWGEIGRWEHSLIKDQFQADHELSSKARELTADLEDTQDKIAALYNFVSQDIQYKIVRGGIFGYKPNKAANVLHNEWGDCKDKATLLITMLDEIGIEAHYATIRTRDAGTFVEEIPSNQCNHAIVYIPQTGGLDASLWVDGTALEHGMDSLPWRDQGVTAMVWNGDGQMSMTTTPVESAAENESRFTLHVALQPDGSAEVDGRWVTTGQPATGMRRAFKQTGQRAERLTQLLNRMAPGSVLQNAEFSDLTRRDAPVEIEMRFRAANYGVTRGSEMVLRPKSPFQVTSQFAPREVRHYDVWLPYRQRRFFTERYAIPEGYAVKSLPKSIELSSPWMEYRATVTHDDGSITVTRELVTKSIQIPRAGYDELRRFCVRVDEYEAQGIVLSRERS